jgi:hypothetical protein
MSHSQNPHSLFNRIFSFNQHHTTLGEQSLSRHLKRQLLWHSVHMSPTASSISSTTLPSPSSKHSLPCGSLLSMPNSRNSCPTRPSRFRMDVSLRYDALSCPPIAGGVKFSFRRMIYVSAGTRRPAILMEPTSLIIPHLSRKNADRLLGCPPRLFVLLLCCELDGERVRPEA